MMRRAIVTATLMSGAALLALPLPGLPDGVVTATPLGQQEQKQLVLSLPNATSKIRLGLPDFTVENPDPELQQAAKTVADVLWNDIDFEQEFYMIPRNVTASIPVTNAIQGLPYQQWTDIGADFVFVGTLRRAAPDFQLDLHVIGISGTSAQKDVFAQRYTCSFKDPRRCAHYISDDFHKQEGGLEGVAQTKIAFTSDRDAERLAGRSPTPSGHGKEIYIADYDGANQQRVTVNRSVNLSGAWAPDGRTFAYTSWATGFPDIYVTSFDGRAPQRPAAGGTSAIPNYLPAWSPKGDMIAFQSSRGGSTDIWIVNSNGTGLRDLTRDPRNLTKMDNAPTWSPSGTQIAFTSDRTGVNQIYTMNTDGTGLQRVVSDCPCDHPTWSPPPFNYIAYTFGPGYGHEIHIYDIATGRIRVLADSAQGDSGSPSFSANGRHIAFVTTRYGKEQIAIIGLDGKIQRQITKVGTNTWPSWSGTPR